MLFYVFLIILVGLWFVSFYLQNDFSLPTWRVKKFKRILVVYPHPDDEVMTVGGMVNRLQKTSTETILVVMTKGEAGESYIKNINDLKVIRTEEMQKATSILGFKDLIQLDLGDGKLENNLTNVKYELKKALTKYKPDLVITYDTSGLYGHPDHIAVSREITKLRTKYKFNLWYSSLPKQTLKMAKLPTHMAKDANFVKRRVFPTHKVFVGLGVIAKSRALYAHKSQYMSFRNAYPFKFIPLWFYVFGRLFEYFYEL